MIVHHEEAVLDSRFLPGPKLFYIAKMPETRPAALVGILHGYADHSYRYEHVMGRWAEAGIGSIGIDMRGHGRAEGVRGYCKKFADYMDDAAELARLLEERAKGVPTFLFGHSFGGLVALASVLETPRSYRGLILSAPYLRLAMAVPPVKVMAAKVASSLFPKLALPSGMNGAMVTHDPARARNYDEDPLSFRTATARFFTEAAAAQTDVASRARELTLPLYAVMGTADPIADFNAVRTFVREAGSADKTWDEREGLLHEPLSEPEWPEVADAIAGWINKRIAS
jgi:alpha-beta hydrolase superfamily lysophospholipase